MIHQGVCSFLLFQIINAQQYFNVSSNSNCNDQCDGSYQFPFNSINQALISGAKNLILFGGTYIGTNNYDLLLVNGPYNINSYQGPSSTIINCQFQNSRSAFIIQSSSVQINGLTIQNCQNTEDEGGALNIYSASVSLVNMSFINNFAKRYGGAIYSQSASYTCYLCNFSNNSVQQQGGAIYVLQGSVSLTSAMINQNQANTIGGGIFINQSQILITNTQINDNSIQSGSNDQYSTSKKGAQIGCYNSQYTYGNSTFGSADMYCLQCSVITYLSDGSKVSDECYNLSSFGKIFYVFPFLVMLILF